MNKKIGLIIQGPVISSGVRGPLLRDKNIITQKKDESFVDFNCIENINKLSLKANGLFKNVVLSTWKNQEIDILKNIKTIDKIIISDENQFEEIYIKNNIFKQNYRKQFHTLKVAMDYLNDHDLDFVVKIRTDLFVDLDQLYEECVKTINKQTILINNGIRQKTRFLELDDFILGAEPKLFAAWMENIMNIEFRNWGGSHHRLMLSYLWAKYEKSFKYNKLHFFHQEIENNSNKLSNLAIREWEYFHILDKDILSNSKLRGEKLDKRYFEFDVQKPLKGRHKFKYNFTLYFKWFRENLL